MQALVDLTGIPLQENEDLYAEYESIIEEMESAQEKALSNTTNNKDTIQDRRVKFLSGAGLWYIVALMVLITKKKTEKWSFKRIFNNFCSTVLCVGIGSGIGWVLL